MHRPLARPRALAPAFVTAVVVWLSLLGSGFGEGPPKSAARKGDDPPAERPEFARVKELELRRSLFEAWKAKHGVSTKSAAGIQAAPGTSIVSRASMVINNNNQVSYTKSVVGQSCDPNVEANNTNAWKANTAYAAGAVVRPVGAFSAPGGNGFHGFNFIANNAGTSAATEPTWPKTIVGATVVDNTITWRAIGFDPAQLTGCTPLQMFLRQSGGSEAVIANEGDVVAGTSGAQLAGWNEFHAMNASGLVAFRAALAGFLWSDQEDEGESAIVTVGPGPGAATKIATSNDTIGGRALCGLSAMVGMNAAGQIVFDGLSGFRTATSCDEDDHGLIRFSSGPGNELLVAVGSAFGGSTVIGFGQDNHPSPGACSTCGYNNIDGFINAAGHVPVVLNLADGTQGVFNFSAPGVATQVARQPTGTISPRVNLNDSDQVVFKAVTGGVDRIQRFTPPSTTINVASVGDDIGLRTGGAASGVTIATLGTFFDINNSGNIVFAATLSGTQSGYYYFDGTTGLLSEILRVTGTNSINSQMITINGANQVAYVTGNTQQETAEGASEGHETGGLFVWTKVGGSQKLIAVGDVINGNAVTAVYAQHPSFARRQFNSQGCAATAFMVANDDPEFDCTEGQNTAACNSVGAQLFVNCAGIIATPTPTPTGVAPTATATPTATPTLVVTQPGVVVPTLNVWGLVFLGLLLAATAIMLIRVRQ